MMEFSRRTCRFLRFCCNVRALLSFAGISLILYNEWISYSVYSSSWISLPTKDEESQNVNTTSEINILLVADPQIVGLRDEHWLLGYITRWDCDRYLYAGFHRAMSHTNPTIVIFLGDLIDEGSKASDIEFKSYVRRFNNIFKVPPNVKTLFVSGDNDVGGEWADLKESWKVKRFHNSFPLHPSFTADDDDITTIRNVDFIRLSYDVGEQLTESKLNRLRNISERSHSNYKVLCNHMPITNRRDNEHPKVLSIMDPKLIFSSHTHLGAIHRCSNCHPTEAYPGRALKSFDKSKHVVDDDHQSLPSKKKKVPTEQKRQHQHSWEGDVIVTDDWWVHALDMDDPYILHEIIVPTCSYRMGVPDMGYGSASIDADGILRYTVLWLPSRYTQLYSYVAFLIIAAIQLALQAICRLLFRSRAK